MVSALHIPPTLAEESPKERERKARRFFQSNLVFDLMAMGNGCKIVLKDYPVSRKQQRFFDKLFCVNGLFCLFDSRFLPSLRMFAVESLKGIIPAGSHRPINVLSMYGRSKTNSSMGIDRVKFITHSLHDMPLVCSLVGSV